MAYLSLLFGDCGLTRARPAALKPEIILSASPFQFLTGSPGVRSGHHGFIRLLDARRTKLLELEHVVDLIFAIFAIVAVDVADVVVIVLGRALLLRQKLRVVSHCLLNTCH